MGTKIGGEGYSPYHSFDPSANSKESGDSQIEKRLTGIHTYEGIVEHITEDKLTSITPCGTELNELNKFNDRLQSSLSDELRIDERHMIGSSVKMTMIDDPEKRDVDVMIVLSPASHGGWLEQENGPQNCLNKVRDSLKKNPQFANTQISVDKNAVTVKKDGKVVDIVPAFRNPNGRGFLIPETSDGMKWIKTDPRVSKRILDIADKNNSGQVKSLVKVTKDWNKRNGRLLRSSHIEAIVLQHFRNSESQKEKKFHEQVNEFFYRLPDYLREDTITDPATDERMGGYLVQSKRDSVMSCAMKSKRYVMKERNARRNGKVAEALRYYKKLLGC